MAERANPTDGAPLAGGARVRARIVAARQLPGTPVANDNPLPRQRILARIGWAAVAVVVIASTLVVLIG